MIAIALLSLATITAPEWELFELEAPTEARSMAPRFSGAGDWLTWIEVSPEGGWVLASAGIDLERRRREIASAARDAWFVNWADRPVLSADTTDALAATWLRMNGEGTYAYDAVVSVSVDGGGRWTAPRKLHSDEVEGEHGFVSLTPRAAGGWAACWLDGRAMGGGHDAHGHAAGDMQLRLAHVDYEGRAQRERVLDERVCECCPTALAPLPGGGAVLVYRDRAEDETRDFSYVFCTDPELDRWSSPRRLHGDGWVIEGCPVNGAALATQGDELAVTWFTMGKDETPRVLYAFWDEGSNSFGAPIEIEASRPLGRVSAAMLPNGELAVCWLEALSGAEAAEWRLGMFRRDEEQRASQVILQTSASRASGISALAGRGDELLFSCADVEERRIRAFRLTR